MPDGLSLPTDRPRRSGSAAANHGAAVGRLLALSVT